MVAPYAALGAFLRQVRTDSGLTQRQLAVKLHTSHSAVSRLESGRHAPRMETLDTYARVLRRTFVLEYDPKGARTWQARIA
jgi:transcriptional regulator with XRE-family HTH domain